MIATNTEDVENLTLETTLKVQKMRKQLAELPPITSYWQFGCRYKRNWLEEQIKIEIDHARRLQRWSDKIEMM